MSQMTFSDIEYSGRKKTTKREKFLDAMDSIIPWDGGRRHSHYPTGNASRPRI